MKTLFTFLAAALLSQAALAHTAVEESMTLFSVLETTEADRPGWGYWLLVNEGIDEAAAKAAVKLAVESEKRFRALADELVGTVCRDAPVLAANRDALADRLAENHVAFEAAKLEQAEALKALLTPQDYDRAIFYVKSKVATSRSIQQSDPVQLVRDGKLDAAEIVQSSCTATTTATKGEPT